MTTRELEHLDIVYVDRHRRRQSLSSSSSVEISPCRVSKWVRILHQEKLRYRCSSCPYISARKSNVGRHFDRKHIELKKPKKCSACLKTFKTKGEYHDHTERHHQHLWPSSSSSDGIQESDFSQIILRSSQSNNECMQKADQEIMDRENNNDIYTKSLELDFAEDSEQSSMDGDSCAVTSNQLPWNSAPINGLLFSKKYQQAEKDAVMALLILHCPDYYLRIHDSW